MRLKKVGKRISTSYENWREYIIIHHEITKMKKNIKSKTTELKKNMLKALNLKQIKK